MRIEYSDDYANWTELAAPENPGYTVDATYPFQLAQASGIDELNATNLNDERILQFVYQVFRLVMYVFRLLKLPVMVIGEVVLSD